MCFDIGLMWQNELKENGLRHLDLTHFEWPEACSYGYLYQTVFGCF